MSGKSPLQKDTLDVSECELGRSCLRGPDYNIVITVEFPSEALVVIVLGEEDKETSMNDPGPPSIRLVQIFVLLFMDNNLVIILGIARLGALRYPHKKEAQ
uniref:Uncharacterized protein n=1 Tax=Compsopogon caeruleus TaxID=31354 RepID=A0A7S1XD41_9RHOD|mmetsp:Transcript_18202/g.37954  ORF Transcript_18202/g.37954 Transcript_18202/m.37954 type:complete len:101 (+) Transcript_18202:650-952(+)